MRLKILLRNITKKMAISVITITGFAVSLSIALVITAFLIKEYSYDKAYPNIDRIYRVFANDRIASVREDFREYFLDKYPEIEDACRYNNYTSTVTYENIPFTGSMIVTDSSFFHIFSMQFLIGDAKSSLYNPNDVILTESFARKIFGNENPVGKTLVAEYKEPLIVSGVIKDFSEYSSIRGDFLTNSELKIIYEGSSDGQGNQVNYFRMFILVNGSGNISRLEQILTDDISSIHYNLGYSIDKINLIPFSDSYFMQGINRSQTNHANLKLIRLLSLISAIIILLAVFNYVNLSTASHSDRFKEVGIKITAGALKKQIFMQFMSESFMVCFISFLLALFLSFLWAPFFERFLDTRINLDILFRPISLVCLIAGIFLISFIAGIYPSLSVSRHRPITILLKRKITQQRTFGLRAVLNIIQNVVSVSLIIALIVLSRQIEYIRTKDFGFETDQLLRVNVHWRLTDKASAIRDRLLADPVIKNVCFSHGSPGSIYSYSSWDVLGDNDNMINELSVDTAFLSVFRIPVIQGRDLLPSDFNKVCYINETAYKRTGWDSFIGKKIHGLEVIGVVKDFHFADMYNQITPLKIQITSMMSFSHLTIRSSTENLPRVLETLTDTWKEICPGYGLNYQFYDEWLDSMYKGEERLVSSIRLFAVLAIMISCLGILGLAEFSIRRRIKEIGIRKVTGAKISDVMALLNKDFIMCVILGFVLACPLGYFIMHSWLENFAYKTDLSWWIFALAGLLALGIALLTVSWQSWKAATRNPVEALRYE